MVIVRGDGDGERMKRVLVVKCMEGDLTLVVNSACNIYRGCPVEVYTWNLSNLVNQCQPGRFNKIKKVKTNSIFKEKKEDRLF